VRNDPISSCTAYSSGYVNDTDWHHLVGTYNGSEVVIYVDGVYEGDCSVEVTPAVPAHVRIGARDSVEKHYFNGTIDDVRIYDRALDADEVEELYKVGAAGYEYGSPLFADANSDDYHLASRRGRYWPAHDVWVLDPVTSPCVDYGDPNVRPENEPVPNGGRVNVGAFGNTAYASMSEWPLKGDFNHDGIVNGLDFATWANEWLEALAWFEE